MILEVVHFLRFFQKCRKFENCCHLLSNMMYNRDLKLKIGRGAEKTANILTKRPFWQIWVLVILPFWDFEVLLILPFSKIFDHLLPIRGTRFTKIWIFRGFSLFILFDGYHFRFFNIIHRCGKDTQKMFFC